MEQVATFRCLLSMIHAVAEGVEATSGSVDSEDVNLQATSSLEMHYVSGQWVSMVSFVGLKQQAQYHVPCN